MILTVIILVKLILPFYIDKEFRKMQHITQQLSDSLLIVAHVFKQTF